MEPKRKAAAHVFMEQQAAQQDGDDEMRPAAEPFPMPQLAAAMPPTPPMPAPPAPRRQPPRDQQRQAARSRVSSSGLKTSEELQLEKEPIRVRETGIWFWRRIIVPPNAYVVHTRIGRRDPVTLGLGLSFRYNA